VRDTLAEAWRASIGQGGGYRRKITARPVIAGGRVFAMDSDAVVSAFDARTGGRLWRFETASEDTRSTNVGGGIALDGGTLYAATGLADVVALDAAGGKQRWRTTLPTAARAAPTVADGRLYIPTLDNQMLALAATDGKKLWAYQATAADTSVLGLPSPAFADGLLVAGFAAGDLICLRAASGAVSWTDSLASVRGRTSLVDFSAIHGMPVIAEGRVYAAGLGGLLISLDLRSGRRLWEREIGSDQTPWLAGDWLFVLTTDQVMVAVNRDDGAIAWLTQLPQWQNEEKQEDPVRWLGPALAGDRLIVAGSSSEALAVSPYTGKILGRQPLSGAASVPPVVADGTVFVVTDDGSLLALR
jgi:outer membrane protein assembly factor BamB